MFAIIDRETGEIFARCRNWEAVADMAECALYHGKHYRLCVVYID